MQIMIFPLLPFQLGEDNHLGRGQMSSQEHDCEGRQHDLQPLAKVLHQHIWPVYRWMEQYSPSNYHYCLDSFFSMAVMMVGFNSSKHYNLLQRSKALSKLC